MRKRAPYRSEFNSQKFSAKKRGIEFLLTFEEWLGIWIASGHLHERGRKRGQYVMARNGDVGPYAVWNVRIIKTEENRAEQKEMPIGRKSKPNNLYAAKLKTADILEILTKYSALTKKSLWNTAERNCLAKQFNVDPMTINNLIAGRTYKKIKESLTFS